MIFTSEQMHGADRYAVEVLNIPSADLMRSAAKALFSALKLLICKRPVKISEESWIGISSGAM